MRSPCALPVKICMPGYASCFRQSSKSPSLTTIPLGLSGLEDGRVHIGPHTPKRMHLRSTDLDETIAQVGQALAPHRMEVDESARIATRFSCLEMASAKIADIRYGTDAVIVTTAPSTHFLMHALLDGESSIEIGTRATALTRDRIVVSQPGEQIRIRFSPQSRHLTALISRASLESYMRDQLSMPVTAALEFDRGKALTGEWTASWRQVLRMAMLSSGDGAIFHGDTSAPLSQLMFNLIIANCPNNYSQMLSCTVSGVPWYVRRARTLIREKLEASAEHLAADELAREAGVSIRSLQSGFREHLGTSVGAYVRGRRLEMLDQALRHAGKEATVTSVMLECGIVSHGRYAGYYKDRFGRPPAEALRRN